MIRFMSAVLIVTRQLEAMRSFYADVLGLPLVEESHGDTDQHFGCELGDIHFAIHPAENFDQPGTLGAGSIRLAFEVPEMTSFVDRVMAAGFSFHYPPKDLGFAVITALCDPDGNYLEFTQLSDSWYFHLERRRQQGHDVLVSWKMRLDT